MHTVLPQNVEYFNIFSLKDKKKMFITLHLYYKNFSTVYSCLVHYLTRYIFFGETGRKNDDKSEKWKYL